MSRKACTHWWRLDNPETASGGLVGASCLRCGRTRTFPTEITARSAFSLTPSDRQVIAGFGRRR